MNITNLGQKHNPVIKNGNTIDFIAARAVGEASNK